MSEEPGGRWRASGTRGGVEVGGGPLNRSSSATQGDWVGWVGTFDDIIAGREGQYRLRLKDNHHRWDCTYPGIVRLPGGTFVCTSYGHWDEGKQPYILSVRLTMEELDNLHLAATDR